MKYAAIISFLAVLLLCVLPATAVIQEVTVKGTVSGMSQDKNTVTIANPLQYGCAYPASGDPVCSYTSMSIASLTGSVPSASAFTIFKNGDTVVATSVGGAGGEWIAIAKLYNDLPSGQYVTDLVGEPSVIPTPLVGNYALDISTAPDCNTCFGTTCTAATATVNVLSDGNRVIVKTLEPRQALLFNERNDASSVAVTFVKGEAPSVTCAGGESGMTGPQPISVYIVNVVPPLGFTSQPAETPTALSTAVPTTVPTTKAASLPFIVIGAIGLGAALLAYRRQ
ncbi:hypothetical protein [Methanoregula sp.]|uniref:hypothetical protein n=1 Tax=Methanoregula sp. TaxID=2052170 RepID=UPI002372E1FB|nr:hypothetical protein [Methanoregula sp.]MDD1686637.1 hypothetical protein [Methanoregula sp.]